jgi:hypothetical protein
VKLEFINLKCLTTFSVYSLIEDALVCNEFIARMNITLCSR